MLTVEQEIQAWRTAQPADAPFGTCPCCGRTAPPPGGMTPIFGLMSVLEVNGCDATEGELAIELDGYGFTAEQVRSAAAALATAGLITTSQADSPDDCCCGSDKCVGCAWRHLVFEPVAPSVR